MKKYSFEFKRLIVLSIIILLLAILGGYYLYFEIAIIFAPLFVAYIYVALTLPDSIKYKQPNKTIDDYINDYGSFFGPMFYKEDNKNN